MPVLREFSGASPVAERIVVNAEILGRFGDPHVFIQLGNRAPPQRVRWVSRYYDAVTLTNHDTNEKRLRRHANRGSTGLCGLAKVDRHVCGPLHGNRRGALPIFLPDHRAFRSQSRGRIAVARQLVPVGCLFAKVNTFVRLTAWFTSRFPTKEVRRVPSAFTVASALAPRSMGSMRWGWWMGRPLLSSLSGRLSCGWANPRGILSFSHTCVPPESSKQSRETGRA